MNKHYEIQYGKNPEFNPIYMVISESDTFKLYASPLDKGWSCPGKFFSMVKDTGNGLKIQLDNRHFDLTYLEAEELRLLLKLREPNTKLFEVTKKAVK